MRKAGLVIIVILYLVVPFEVYGQGLVPCEGTECNICHLVIMANRVMNFLAAVFSVLAAIVFSIAGVKFVVSMGNPAAKDAARRILVNTAVGLTIVLIAWVLIDTGMRIFTDSSTIGPWNEVECVDQEAPRPGVLDV